jgi:plasmid maintenance system killer protein
VKFSGCTCDLLYRINDQWRICFTWTALGAADVEITDYHLKDN